MQRRGVTQRAKQKPQRASAFTAVKKNNDGQAAIHPRAKRNTIWQ